MCNALVVIKDNTIYLLTPTPNLHLCIGQLSVLGNWFYFLFLYQKYAIIHNLLHLENVKKKVYHKNSELLSP